MSRISAIFEKKVHKALIPYITTGYPSIEATLRAVPLMAAAGADIIELGIPFSDPLADGATIQESSYQALQSGINTSVCLDMAAQLRKKSEIPLVFMTYYNPVLKFGPEKFCTVCSQKGIDGLIVPDLPPEEGSELERCAEGNSLDMIYLLSPNSTEERIKLVTAKSHGFVYLVSVTGVTGVRTILPASTRDFVFRVRNNTALPLCVGFGISTPEQAGQVAQVADGVIIGSKIIQLMKQDPSLKSLADFISRTRTAIDSG